jgi:hypothetical protein
VGRKCYWKQYHKNSIDDTLWTEQRKAVQKQERRPSSTTPYSFAVLKTFTQKEMRKNY